MIESKNGIVGLAIGDAMGVPLEFCTRMQLMKKLTTKMKEYGSHNMPKGCWSDDTSMTLALIDAINKTGNIIPEDIANNFVEWAENSKYTATGRTFDIGRTCLRAIINFERKVAIAEECGEESEFSNGNGSLMRILPLIYYCLAKKYNDEEVYKEVKKVSSITHKHELSIMGCYIYVLFGMELLKKNNIKEAYKKIKEKSYSFFSDNCQFKYSRILRYNINDYNIEEIKSSGYVLDTLEATLWTLLNTDSYNNAVIKAINLGDDTDTVGACVGGLAGIYYGIEAINSDWKNDLLEFNYIVEMCNSFDKIINN